jgi:hypothetical protein
MHAGSENGSKATVGDGVLHVAFVLDKSGSMQSVEEAVVAGYNNYLRELRGQGGETRFTLTTFDTRFEHVCIGEPLDIVAELDHRDYRPGGMTALYDAIAHTVLQTDRRLHADGRGVRRAAQLDVRLSRRRPRQHRGGPTRRLANRLQGRQRDALDCRSGLSAQIDALARRRNRRATPLRRAEE